MNATIFAAVNGERVTSVRLTVANTGPWVADVDFEGEPKLSSGRVTLDRYLPAQLERDRLTRSAGRDQGT